jgi:hypothetical protein
MSQRIVETEKSATGKVGSLDIVVAQSYLELRFAA